ncbi:MAG: MFS transporter [Deltaproteobacteria bacterium]|nr:MFS transporter [Deltaproteobacteria bacterium]
MSEAPKHSAAFRRRRFFNWFPLGLAYAMLYMGRYNLTVAKTSLGVLMTKEDFGFIFAAGTVMYAFSFLLNGPMVDKMGGRKGMIIALIGSGTANGVMGYYLYNILNNGGDSSGMRATLSIMYAINMYFQSFAAVSIVKVNSHWFHVRERGGFSGIFGTMISSGIFFAFTGNQMVLTFAGYIWPGRPMQHLVFAAPAIFLFTMLVIEIFLLQNTPADAGFEDFDTGDASSGEDDKPIPTLQIFKSLFTNPIIMTVAAIEFCTGILRNGVMHWFPIYAKEVWALPSSHALRYGPLADVILAPVRMLNCSSVTPDGLCSKEVIGDVKGWLTLILISWSVAMVSAFLAKKAPEGKRAKLVIAAALGFLVPIFPMGWGGFLFTAGVIGGNVAGWVSDLFFQSRRGPAAGGLYAGLAICTGLMFFVLAPPPNDVGSSKVEGILVGDKILSVDGTATDEWENVFRAFKCVVPTCKDSTWDADRCSCSTAKNIEQSKAPSETGEMSIQIERAGQKIDLFVKDPRAVQRAGDSRKMKVGPVLPMSPWWLGVVVFFMSLCVIGTHGLLSGTATMDFGGRKAAGTTVGVIDGFVYLGTAIQSISLGYLTSQNWQYWPMFMLPFALIGFYLLTRIWHATPNKKR